MRHTQYNGESSPLPILTSGHNAGGRGRQQAGLQPAHAIARAAVRARGAAAVRPAARAVRWLRNGVPDAAAPQLRPRHGAAAADPHPCRQQRQGALP